MHEGPSPVDSIVTLEQVTEASECENEKHDALNRLVKQIRAAARRKFKANDDEFNRTFFAPFEPPHWPLIVNTSDLPSESLIIGGWESARAPADDSLDALRQWFEFLLHPRGLLSCEEIRDCFQGRPGSCSAYVRDTWRFVEHLKAKGLIQIPNSQELRDYSAHEAIVVLTQLKERLFPQQGGGGTGGQDKAVANEASQKVHEPESKKPGVDDSPAGQWIFAPSGNGYYIAGLGERGHLSDIKGLGVIARLLKTPSKLVPMLELVRADERLQNDKQSPQDAAGPEELQKIRDRLNELRADEDRSRAEGDTVAGDTARREREELTQRLKSDTKLFGELRDLNNRFEAWRPRIYGQLQTVYEKMRKANPPMNKLAEHFELHIRTEGGSSFVYSPPSDSPPWQFDIPAQK